LVSAAHLLEGSFLGIGAQQVLQKLDAEVDSLACLQILQGLIDKCVLNVGDVRLPKLQDFNQTVQSKLLRFEGRLLIVVLSNIPKHLAVKVL
jgi:hypothetical protein